MVLYQVIHIEVYVAGSDVVYWPVAIVVELSKPSYRHAAILGVLRLHTLIYDLMVSLMKLRECICVSVFHVSHLPIDQAFLLVV